MTERVIVLDRGGHLKLWAVNGDAPREVASMEVGTLSEVDTVLAAMALTDLRDAINGLQPAPARHTGERVAEAIPAPARSLPPARKARKAPAKSTKGRAATGRKPKLPGLTNSPVASVLNLLHTEAESDGRLGLTTATIRETLPRFTTKAVSNALNYLKAHGKAYAVGGNRSGHGARWYRTEAADQAERDLNAAIRTEIERHEPTEPPLRVRVSTNASERERDAARLLEVLQRHPDGMKGNEWFDAARIPRGRRHAVDALVAAGLVRREGNTRAAVWYVNEPAATTAKVS